MNKEILMSCKNLKKHFFVRGKLGHKNSCVRAVDGIDIEIYKGETFGLVGESGCGKSTLGRTLIRIYDVTEGEIYYKNNNISKLKNRKLRDVQSSMQIIFQDPYAALNPFWNVKKILEEPLLRIGKSKEEINAIINIMLGKVGLSTDDLEKFPYEFSGGQRQRIGIMRALSVNPEFVMCDEPTSALDVSVQAQIANLLKELQEDMGLTYLFSAHDLSMVRYISDRIGVMYLGKIVEVGETEEICKYPRHPYTKALLEAVPIADPIKAQKRTLARLKGEIPGPMDIPSGCRFAPRCLNAMPICHEQEPKLEGNGHKTACFLLQ